MRNEHYEYICPHCGRDITVYVKWLMMINRKTEIFTCACGDKIKYTFGLLEAKIEKYKGYI